MLNLGLIDLIAHKHGHSPRTHIRSKNSTIDCIFGSPHLQIRKGGFLSFSKLMSGYRGLWIDLPKILIYGYNPPQPSTFKARKLKIGDPRVVKKYISYVLEKAKDQNIP